MYSIAGFGRMIADSVRMDAYTRALRQSIRPGSVVLDIGTGTGIFALLACQYGARRVFAIEPDDAIAIARANAAANGFADRIEFFQDISTRVTLPERADVIVSDLRGRLPPFDKHISTIIDARHRLLAPGGVLIPQSDSTWAAVVEAPDVYSNHVIKGYEPNAYGLNLRAALEHTTNAIFKAAVTPAQLLASPQCWATLDYTTIENANFSAAITFTAMRAGTAHGLVVWFDATLAEGVSFTNAPGHPELIYGNILFPWSQPVALSAGDCVEVNLRADLVGTDYVWSWDSRVLDAHHPGQVKAHFKQSMFFGTPIAPARLRKQAASHVPALGEDGAIDRFILELMNGQASVGDIARQLCERFPDRFLDRRDALTRVGELSAKYSR